LDGDEDSFIFKLHEELVWRIFLFNAHLNDGVQAVDASQSLAAPLGQDPAFSTNGLTVTHGRNVLSTDIKFRVDIC